MSNDIQFDPDVQTDENATSTDEDPPSEETSHSDRPDRSVVVPVYRERVETWTAMVEALLGNGFAEVVICVDDPDPATMAALEDYRDRRGVVWSVSYDRRGKGGALHRGLTLATGEVVGYVDADGAIPVSELQAIYRAVERRTGDLVIGSRKSGDGRTGQPWTRRALGAGYRWLARRVTGLPVEDFQCGAKALTWDVWTAVAGDLREDGFAFDTELVAVADHHGFSVAEVPVRWADPGDSDVAPLVDTPRMFSALRRIRDRLPTIEPQRAELNVALVSSHPPNRGHLSEYGQRLAAEYAGRDDVSLTVLSRKTDGAPQLEIRNDYCLRRCWRRDSLWGAYALLRQVRRDDYDVVQFNVHMTYFGTSNAYRLIGLALPPFLRLFGVTVVTTLHDMLEVVADEVAAEQVGRVERLGARLATQLVLLSDATTLTSPVYRDLAVERYRAGSVYHVPHGTFFRADGAGTIPDGPLRILVFGHLSPSKDVATVMAAFEQIREEVPDAELQIAGGSHPGYPGYREDLEAEYGDRDGVTFTGYVPDDEMDQVWLAATMLVMPYRTATGVSGVFQLAKSYGVPVVASGVEGMATATSETGGDAEFVEPGDADDLAETVLALDADRDRLADLARRNAAAASAYTIGETADRLVDILVAHHDGDSQRVPEVVE